MLRDYQLRAVEEAHAALRDNPVLVMATGGGKTYTAAALVKRTGLRTLWIAHRRELIDQAAQSLERLGLLTGLILAGRTPTPRAPVQVASIQTLARREVPPCDLVVIDECHHASKDSQYARLFDLGVPVLGLTATPFRLDGHGLGDVGFGRLIVGATPADLCREGVLHEPTVYAPVNPDLTGIKRRGGDFEQGALGRAMSQPTLVGNVVDTWIKHAQGRRTVVFATTVEHSVTLCQRFQRAGVAAEHLDGTTPIEAREAILARLRQGRTHVLCNVGIVSEGYDLPALECAVIARPTESLCLHLQVIGRVMRSADAKLGALVLDHAGNTARHGFVTDPVEYSLASKIKPAGQGTTKTCPGCSLVIAMGENPCPECGYEWQGNARTAPVEVAGELQRVSKHAADAPEAQEAFYQRMREVAMRRGQEPDRIASAAFKTRYGYYPLVVRGCMVDAADATPADWDALRRDWRAVAQRKGWDAGKTAWWVRKCETEARQRALQRA